MVTLSVNGKRIEIDVEPDKPLLWVLREDLQLIGTKYGRGVAKCGACTVHVNGMPRRSCVTPISSVDGATVITIEGAEGKVADAVRSEWIERNVPQCGYCQSGQIMSAISLLTEVPSPSNADVDRAMAGNVCRCATYVRIRAAIHGASKRLKG